jgi:hypothetical protein
MLQFSLCAPSCQGRARTLGWGTPTPMQATVDVARVHESRPSANEPRRITAYCVPLSGGGGGSKSTSDGGARVCEGSGCWEGSRVGDGGPPIGGGGTATSCSENQLSNAPVVISAVTTAKIPATMAEITTGCLRIPFFSLNSVIVAFRVNEPRAPSRHSYLLGACQRSTVRRSRAKRKCAAWSVGGARESYAWRSKMRPRKRGPDHSPPLLLI